MKEGCRPFMDRFCETLGEDPSSPLCRELEKHLKDCPDCSLQVNTIKRTVEIYRALPRRKVPGEVQERLLVRLNLPCKKGDC
jgi:RNA polymerase sigma-70 factor (ECF subfamily)